MFPSRKEAWRDARTFIDAFCRSAAVPREACLKANLVVEELFLNTVGHGHHGGSDAPVWITLERSDDRIHLTYEDRAAPFNPFAPGTRDMLEALAGVRREGGLGVLLAQGLTATAEYAYVYGRNRVRLVLA
ncbi:MAG TPA: ATP-binding protein [Usitatibacter sp.]|jgi:anti-sigma regulatory factor (Ser/Thr protein kinase)|nr:ATP-binding protein [Usitatibacter sp.]